MLEVFRSLVRGKAIYDPFLLHHRHHHNNNDCHRHPCLLFVPKKQIVSDTVELARLAREMGMEFIPDPCLTSIIFSWPPPPSPCSPPSQPPQASLPFPSLSPASFIALRNFSHLSRGLFQVIFCNASPMQFCTKNRQLDPPGSSLFSSLTGNRIDGMPGLCRTLAGDGWSLFQSGTGSSHRPGRVGVRYLFRKAERSKIRIGCYCKQQESDESLRVREMILPELDFSHVPVRILHYIILMSDDLFYLARKD